MKSVKAIARLVTTGTPVIITAEARQMIASEYVGKCDNHGIQWTPPKMSPRIVLEHASM